MCPRPYAFDQQTFFEHLFCAKLVLGSKKSSEHNCDSPLRDLTVRGRNYFEIAWYHRQIMAPKDVRAVSPGTRVYIT